jgi:hypothetical protein
LFPQLPVQYSVYQWSDIAEDKISLIAAKVGTQIYIFSFNLQIASLQILELIPVSQIRKLLGVLVHKSRSAIFFINPQIANPQIF